MAVSALPVASLVGASAVAASGAASAVTTVPLALSAGGAVLVVKTVELSAQGTVWVLERLSDGARASVRLSSRAAGATSVGVGTLVTVSLTGAGVLLSASGQVLAFIPNAMGEALLANDAVDADALRHAMATMLHERFDIDHATLQPELPPAQPLVFTPRSARKTPPNPAPGHVPPP